MSIEEARAVYKETREKAASLPVELKVKDMAHARSPEVISFAISHLKSGGTYAELRSKLGCGPAYSDKRWRVVRDILCEAIIPDSEEDALKASQTVGNYLKCQLEELVTEIDTELKDMGSSKEEIKVRHNYYKLKLDGIKALMDDNQESLASFYSMKKLKANERKTQGVSIVVNNNYHIARPGDNAKVVEEID